LGKTHVSGFDERLVRPEQPVLVGVSGGVDSVVLTHLLHASGCRSLVLCHLNHGLRGADSDADERLVRELAERLELPFEGDKADVRAASDREGKSLELIGREARHAFFAQVAAARNCHQLVLAHHADDQAETILMNILRGCGPDGLGGIRPKSTIRVGTQAIEILRPLLSCRKVDLIDYAQEHALAFNEDLSNTSPEHLRNRIRHDLLPEIHTLIGRDPTTALGRLGRLAAEDRAVLDRLARKSLKQAQPDDDPTALLVGELRAIRDDIGQSVLWRLLRTWLRELGVPGVDLATVEGVAELLEDPGKVPAKANLPGGWWVRRRSGRLFVEKLERVVLAPKS